VTLRIISTDQLQALDLPKPSAGWSDLIRFASTFDIIAELTDDAAVSGVADVREGAGIPELRCALYVEWRRYNHFGYEPDASVLTRARQIVEQIRGQLDDNAA
jgi:hypothetical protein